MVAFSLAALAIAVLVALFIGICWVSKQEHLWDWFNIVPRRFVDEDEVCSRVLIRRIALCIISALILIFWCILEVYV